MKDRVRDEKIAMVYESLLNDWYPSYSEEDKEENIDEAVDKILSKLENEVMASRKKLEKMEKTIRKDYPHLVGVWKSAISFLEDLENRMAEELDVGMAIRK